MLQVFLRGSCRPIRLLPSRRTGVCQLSRDFTSSPTWLAKGRLHRTKTPTDANAPRKPLPTKTSTAATIADTATPLARPPQPPTPPPPRASDKPDLRTRETKSKTAPTLSHKTEKLAFPERLLIYHAGTGRTVFLSFIKLSGIFLIIFTGLFVAPAYYFSPVEPTYLAFVYLAGSCIPLAIMTFTAPPFVTYVHLKLPMWARQSATRLQRYTEALPSTSELDVTSLKWIWPRVTRLHASELYLHQGQLSGAMTLRREVPRQVLESRKWYAWRPIKKFYVGGKAGKKSAEPWVWEGVIGAVARGYPKAAFQRRLQR